MQATGAPLAAFNQAQKEADTIYRAYAKAAGLSDTSFWVLYSVAERQTPYTQKELCASWFFPVQTVNSALQRLCLHGLIRLEAVPPNRKNKRIVLTVEGEALVQQTILPLIEAEQRAYARMGAAETAQFLTMTRHHVALLKEEIERVTPIA